MWDPDQYLRYADQRALPFRHLAAAVDHLHPDVVVDLGCGPGGLTATLLDRWPTATILGIDPDLEWARGTILRPVLERLPEDEHEEFIDEYGALLRDAYPTRKGKTAFPFKRTFVASMTC